MTAGTTNTNKHSVTALQVDNTDDLGDVNDGILEKHNIHLGDLGLLVVRFKGVIEFVAQFIEVGNFFVNLAFTLGIEEEVDKDSVLFVGGAVSGVAHLEVLGELFVEHGLNESLITLVNKSIVEDTEDLVAPEFDDLFLALIEVFFDHVHALENLANIAHVENVMGLSGSGEEVLTQLVEQLNSSNSKRFALGADFFVECGEFHFDNCLENALHVLLVRDRVVDHVELTEKTSRDFGTTTTGFTHRRDNLKVANVVLGHLSSVARVPEGVVDVLANELKRRLGAEGVLAGHVEIINEADGLNLGVLGLELVLCPAIVLALNHHLEAAGSGTS